ncbi:SDR family oxidoreductase [Streptomyces sp. SID6673]|nr:SDR family oxidoreductase [Streptomyces sp. SID11726]NEB23860.1 SDR family oxidoreductase [Streptomyces sp. SID6673]
MKYESRVAVVTGAGSGIGRALTHALTAEGAHVAAWDIDEVGLEATSAACPPGLVTAYKVDVADRDAVLGNAEMVRRDHGPASLVFNNAGVDLIARLADTSWADLDWLMGINIGGMINGSKAFLPQLCESGTIDQPARLVNISSAFGLISVPSQGVYSTSKFAVRGFTEALRQEMVIDRHPVTVHCVHPGVVRTNFATNSRIPDTDVDPEKTRKLSERAALTTPEKAARVIIRGMEKNRGRILVGPDGRVAAALPRVFGGRYADLVAHAARVGTAFMDRKSTDDAA